MKRIFLFLSILVAVALACDVSVNIAPTSTVSTVAETPVLIEPPTTTPEVFISLTQAIPATAVPSATPLVQPSPVTSTLVTFGRLTLEIPSSVASGASGTDIAPVTNEDDAYWNKTSGHLQVSLNDYYVLQGKFHQPQIYVYPAMPYVELVPAAFEYAPFTQPVAPITADQLPAVPFFNAAQVFASNIQAVSFQNGSGIRFLTEYAQYYAPVNNYELVYHFQGFTNDGEYYIIAILPITAPVLAETSDAGAVIPAGGITYPDINDSNADFQGYYASITDLLNSTPPEAFTPSIDQLDALIQSMWVAP
ncbi:hypothetical protein [Candidatus Villigracilis affinis]|uniref:hypothetical protein n=1 Tax=Candidatus Villigracilis affinis TaxID=3140682 RepID=UPI002A236E73|nr:hypothetical protein [Anaerolineales bacterium]